MLPLSDLRAAMRQPPYNQFFKQEILRLVGGHKRYQLMESDEHDYLVVAALSGSGSIYPDLRRTSAVKAPVALTDLPEDTPEAVSPKAAPSFLEWAFSWLTSADWPDNGARTLEVKDVDDSGEASSLAMVQPRIHFGDTYPSREGDFDDVITLELIRVPAVTNTGYIMDMSSVQELLKARQRCPFTRKDLTAFTRVDDNRDTEYTLFNGKAKLGSTWMPTLRALRKASGLREFRRLQRIPMYKDFKELMSRALQRELSDEDFVDILERDFKANVSSASPCRKMVLGSKLFGRGKKVVVEQFGARSVWPQNGHDDFFVVLPQPGVDAPYCIPIEKRDASGLFHPPNYYRAKR